MSAENHPIAQEKSHAQEESFKATHSGTVTPVFTRSNTAASLPHLDSSKMETLLKKYEELFTVSPEKMKSIVEGIISEFSAGLEKDGNTVPMLPTYVFGYPSGKETGDFIAVDLGGTNLRVCLVTLRGGGKFEVKQSKYKLTEEQKQQDGAKLFDFCAECVKSFLRDQLGLKEGDKSDLALGFTFSYPCSQEKIDHGVLIRWTKGFGNPNTEGQDCAAMFRESLERVKVPIKLVALVNDTTGSLIASNYVDPSTKIGVILGTGCNAAYMETVQNIPKIHHLGLPMDQEIAINCEWGAFDSFEHQFLPRTKYDQIIDETSNKPGEQAFEKMIAGLYLGEVFRLVLVELIDNGDLFLGQSTYKLEIPFAFDTAYLSLLESDPTEEGLLTIGVFSHFFGLETTLEERTFFRKLAKLVGTRAARLAACGIAAIVKKNNYLPEGCSVGADGSLYDKYPEFADRITQGLVDVFGEEGRKVTTHHAEDGSGVGSSIIAAMTKNRKDNDYFTHL